MFILNQSSDTIFVEEEADNRNGGGVEFIPIRPGEICEGAPNWVYHIHTHTRGSAIITLHGKGPVTFGNLEVKVKNENFIIIT